ncbi:MAG: hypothetical protein ACXVRJ_10410 [Gaiellaceae bacterium]
MFRGRWAAIAAAFAVAAAATVTAGCGGGSSGHALALDPVSAAAAKTQNAGAARIRLDLAVRGQGKVLRLHGVGAIDGTSGELSFDLGSLFRRTGIPAGVDPNATMAQLMHAKMTEVSLEQNGDYVVYLRLGVLSSQIPGGKQWIKLDVSKLGKSAGIDLGNLMSGSQLSPTDLLGVLRSEGAKVQKLGTATVGGTTATHYRVRVDVAKALRAKGLTSPLLNSTPPKMKTLSEDVWIGKDGLVRRVGLAYGSPRGGSPRVAMTMDIFDYGAHVTIAAPPSSDVFDATQLAQQGIGSGLFH